MRVFQRIFSSILLLLIFLIAADAFSVPNAQERQKQNLRWRTSTIQVAVSSSLFKSNLNIADGSDVAGALRRSFETWEKVAAVKFEEVSSEKQTVSPTGNLGDGVSLITVAPTTENLLMFEKDGSSEIAARTRVFFNKKGGITEADIVLNPYQRFSTDGGDGTFDLESILTHEIGHLLGLEHSAILGSTMHESTGKNGVYNLPAFGGRTLAETDIAAIRALYGAKADAESCCGSVSGKLVTGTGRTTKNYQIWAEDIGTGKVSAEVFLNADGSFQIDGLQSGSYRIFAQNTAENKSFAVEEIGEVEVKGGKPANLSKKLNQESIEFQARYIGFNGQLSENAVSVNSGKSYKIYVGGKNLNPEDYRLSFNSPYITVVPKTSVKLDFAQGVSVISFDIVVADDAPAGEYSLIVESKNNQKSVAAGALSIEKFNNPWNIFTLGDE